jgi:hypothetical protein
MSWIQELNSSNLAPEFLIVIIMNFCLPGNMDSMNLK